MRERYYSAEDVAWVINTLHDNYHCINNELIKPCPWCCGKVQVSYMEERNYMFRCRECGNIVLLRSHSEVAAVEKFNGGTQA